jgi:hypothetical protein
MYKQMKKIYDWVVKIPQDKLLHFIGSGLVTAAVIVGCKLFGCGLESVAYGWATGMVTGFGKEVYDMIKDGSSESNDWWADMAGATSSALYGLLMMV